MRLFALLVAGSLFAITSVGCNDPGGGTSAPAAPAPGGAVDEPGEAKAYKAKQAELEAQRLEDIKNGKVPKAKKTTKKR
jgi:hypothetical protein